MLALDATFGGIDPAAWNNLSRLLLPPPPRSPRSSYDGLDGQRGARPVRRQPLVLFLAAGKVAAALHPGRRLPPDEEAAALSRYAGLWHGPTSLRALRKATQAAWVAVLEEDGPRALARVFEGRVRPSDDILGQAMAGVEALREQLGRTLHVDPNPLVIPPPSADQIRRAADLMLPDDRSVILYIVDHAGDIAAASDAAIAAASDSAIAAETDRAAARRPRVFASLALAKRRGLITHVTTHLGLGLQQPTFDLRHDARVLSQGAASKLAPPHLGLYITLAAWRQVVGPQPGALAKAVALGEAIIDPAPAWMLATTGLGAATGVAQGAGKLLGRYLPKAMAKGMTDLARQVSTGPFQALGIDPLDLWQRATRLASGEDD